MSIDFHRDMDKYLTNRRRKRLFSDFKFKIINKKAAVSYKAASKFGKFKEKFTFKAGEIKGKKKEPEKEITQEQIDELVENKGVKREPIERIEPIKEEEEGWKEIKLEELQGKEEDLSNLEEEKKKIEEDLVRVYKKEEAEKEKLAKLSEENEQREKKETEEEKLKRLELEEELNILREKQKIEEGRLTELRKARKREQMEALRGRVVDILFKKRPKQEKDIAEEVVKEVRREAKIKEAERQRAGAGRWRKPEEEIAKAEEKKPEKEEAAQAKEAPKEQLKPEVEQAEVKEEAPKKSFFSNFIQIRTAAEIAKEEEERLKREEEQALKDQLELNKVFQQEEGEEIRTNMPAEEQGANLSTLFPEEGMQQEMQEQHGNGETIELDQGYRIKVVKN